MSERADLLRFIVLALLWLGLVAAARAEAARGAGPKLYAGGVAGITDLLDPSNSQRFRAEGGGLYLHNTGWMKLNRQQHKRVLEIFRGAPIAIELGFGSGVAWGNLYQKFYLSHGIKPVFIAVNAFAHNNHFTLEQWRTYDKDLRGHGVPASTPVLPTFEYQNFPPNIPTLLANRVSVSSSFQALIAAAGGIVLDTPPDYALAREGAYRKWAVDAIRWATQRELTSVVILSPGASGTRWETDTDRYVRYLSNHNAMPSAFVCENYTAAPPPGYPNRVGSDSISYTPLGNCYLLKRQLLPALN